MAKWQPIETAPLGLEVTMTDIVWSLHNDVPCNGDIGCAQELCEKAAAEIEHLRAENTKLRAAVEEIYKSSDQVHIKEFARAALEGE